MTRTGKPRFSIVVAACLGGGIGKDGRLPWQLPTDLTFFRQITSTVKNSGKKNVVLMGRKTWFSIPEKRRPLANRFNVVMSSTFQPTDEKDTFVARNWDSVFELFDKEPLKSEAESIFLIGGSQIYREALERGYVSKIYFTRIDQKFDCDAFLPEIDFEKYRKIENSTEIDNKPHVENGIPYQFEVYEKLE